MVLAEKNNDSAAARNGGRRSRGPSPNGHVHQQESTSEDESSVPVDKIRVGRDYQAVCPELQPEALRKPELLADRALLVWSPTADIAESKLEDYIVLAKDKYGYNGEQALGMLFWHKHDLERAVLDLANFTPFPDEWSVEDKVLFEQAFQFHGKSFHRIRQMLPDKSIASLVKYYYSWKKTRSRTSLMDKQARKLNTPREDGAPSEGGSEGGSNEESDQDEKGERITCSNCGVTCSYTQLTPKGTQCNSCYLHWRRTGSMRPTQSLLPTPGKRNHHHHHTTISSSSSSNNNTNSSTGGSLATAAGGGGGSACAAGLILAAGVRNRRRPPRGMHINHDDLAAVAASGAAAALILRALAREQDALQRQIQQNKQSISSLKRKHSDTIDDLRSTTTTTHDINNSTGTAPSSGRINARWTSEELLLGVQGVRKYGKDFKSIAEVLGNKTEHHVRQFFVNYRKRYNLDSVLKEYERDNGPIINNSVGAAAGVDETNGNGELQQQLGTTTTTTTTVVIKDDSPDVSKMELDDNLGGDSNSDVICISPTPTGMMAAAANSVTTSTALSVVQSSNAVASATTATLKKEFKSSSKIAITQGSK